MMESIVNLEQWIKGVKEIGFERFVMLVILGVFIINLACEKWTQISLIKKLVNGVCDMKEILAKLLQIEGIKARVRPDIANSAIDAILQERDKEDCIIDFKSKKGSKLKKEAGMKQEVKA